ncbi:sulfur oxidation c-type cytochrome SoxX [Sulfurirhabdus autotrophica]|uniref:Monoheme cytochrome SoxX (Sulfur oxidation) n=1 Tax=Sulfurirhabdus autotrophica TaxID=1706046 RepID=A0A4R3XTS2_9PROT|nr:sulfur oxidation c-type cytochrome SoxX [Sulfurirhabdus autotrophica]TCV82520.1 monoheme cytochrome SoxX (sulfur oxidation) [Sulfurirhabdus autotrophica]
MQKRKSLILAASIATILAATGITTAYAADAPAKEVTGKDISFDKSKGNCLACHAMPNIPDAEAPGNIAPPLIAMKARFPDRAKLRAQIWNAMDNNPKTSMPPFGKHKILTEQEIDKVTDFIHSL